MYEFVYYMDYITYGTMVIALFNNVAPDIVLLDVLFPFLFFQQL